MILAIDFVFEHEFKSKFHTAVITSQAEPACMAERDQCFAFLILSSNWADRAS
jgi:hypothetical protein